MAVLHDYECDQCKEVTERMLPYEEREFACHCGGTSRRILSRVKSCQIDIFQAEHYENLGDDMPYISSKAQLAEECEKRGISSVALMNDTRLHGRGRWI